MKRTTKNSRVILANVETIYQAFTTPTAIEQWLAPSNMKGKIHYFDFKIGGSYFMSLYYPGTEKELRGKTSENEDRFSATFIGIIPNKKIVQSIKFESSIKDFMEEMIMEVSFEPLNIGTRVTFFFKDIPIGISIKDNEVGTISTLEKLAQYVELINKDKNDTI